MRNKYMTQPVAAVATELNDHLSDIGDKTSSGTELHDIPIIAGNVLTAFLAQGERGLSRLTPVRSTSAMLRVTKVRLCNLAVAAMKPSIMVGGFEALRRPHSSAISVVTASVRSRYDAINVIGHLSSIVAREGSSPACDRHLAGSHQP
jgi:hypothetical protein